MWNIIFFTLGFIICSIIFLFILGKELNNKNIIKRLAIFFTIVIFTTISLIFITIYNHTNNKLINVPDTISTHEYTSVASNLQNIFLYYGINITEPLIVKELNITKKLEFEPKKIESFVRKYGFKVNISQMTLTDLKKFIDKNIPVIILINKKHINFYSVIVIGYTKDKFILKDPSKLGKVYINTNELLKTWNISINKYNFNNLGIVIYGKTPKYNINLKSKF